MNKFNFYRNNDNIQIAHRGHSSVQPENTIDAFKKALEKTKIIELDVAFSSDGIAVVVHDDTMKRTSDVNKIFPQKKDLPIHEFSLAELKKLNVSSWFITKDPKKTIKNNIVKKEDIKLQQISTLEEVLKFSKENNLSINIEIKDLSKTPFNDVAVDKVIELVLSYKMQEDVIISSFNKNYIMEVEEKNKDINKALLKERTNPKNLLEYLLKYNIQAYHCSDKLVSQTLVKELLSHNIYTCVYTINDKKRKEELFSWGVKAVFTDFLD